MSVEQQTPLLSTARTTALPPVRPTVVNADRFEITGPVRVSFATTSIAGPAQLTYRDGETALSFSGPEITRTATPVGELVSVLLDSVVDTEVRMFTLLLPRVRLQRGDAKGFATVGIATTDRAPAYVPPLGPTGALQSYQTYQLTGVASVLDL